ncbi:MAG: hypothetical protein M1825_001893 [Sarcosagium campestre]|nr:MAG: hypothetical protein M1825_001893 [Sarcosagium campestre]
MDLAEAQLEREVSRSELPYSCPHSWTLLYTLNDQRYEMIFSACSSKEAQVWTEHLASEPKRAAQIDICSVFEAPQDFEGFLDMDIKPLAAPSDILSEEAADGDEVPTTSSDSAPPTRLVIMNTQTLGHDARRSSPSIRTSDPNSPTSNPTSPLNQRRTAFLWPARHRRCRFEEVTSDVWSHDLLPSSIFGTTKGHVSRKPSTGSVMKKLGMINITNTFSKRSSSNSSPTAGVTKGHLPDITSSPSSSKSPKAPKTPRGKKPPRPTDLDTSPCLRSSPPDVDRPNLEDLPPPPWSLHDHRSDRRDLVFPEASYEDVDLEESPSHGKSPMSPSKRLKSWSKENFGRVFSR